ncbi:hypothetical protein [Candidatus Nanohalovita haloferacivicina]|uniref:hypothetical protein n=1 Tax=Candidatus Nanohalovita haloferacivicina TaxID=2978046 RepID=UPI00325FAC9D|nr:hypothetical protein HBNXNv_0645 [Candidatus Nanohalobia archaeon BNXNv]
MPASLFFEVDEPDLEEELSRWANEFQLRPAGFYGRERRESKHISRKVNGGSHTDEELEAVQQRVKDMQRAPYTTDRLAMLHTSTQNISHVEEKGQLPEGFLDDLHEAAAQYIDGFIPGQKIKPPKMTTLEDTDKKYAGTHTFQQDKSTLYRKSGKATEGTPAAETAAHETMHKNNVEALIDDADKVRDLATIYDYNAPEEYREIVEDTEVPEVKHDLVAGLSLLVLDEIYDAGILDAYHENRRHEVDLHQYVQEFEYAAGLMTDIFGLEDFDVRDETMAQAVTYFMKGRFQEGFENHLSNTRASYNEFSQYQENAGDKIAEQLNGFREEMQELEGLQGQRFKKTMENRIPFLKGEYSFSTEK